MVMTSCKFLGKCYKEHVVNLPNQKCNAYCNMYKMVEPYICREPLIDDRIDSHGLKIKG